MNTKYFVLCAAALVMFAACQKEENAAPKVSLTASLEQQIDNTTKTALGTENTVVWSEGDVIKVHGASGVEELTLSGGAGTTTGVFGAPTVTDPDYAFYPASAYSSISSSTVTFTLPATQTYAANSFGNGANVAVAKIVGGNMAFKNVCGALKLQLKGSMKVKKIELTGKSGEKLNGTFTVDAAANPFVGAVKTTGDPTTAEKTITLDCSAFGETTAGAGDGGVQLDFSTATTFNIIVPVGALAGGFDVTVYDVAGDSFDAALSTEANNTIERSTITCMSSKAVSLLPEDYTELNYIERVSAGGIIDTRVLINEMNHTKAKYSLSTVPSGVSYICGTRSTTSTAVGFDVHCPAHNGLTIYNFTWPNQGRTIEANEVVETETIMKEGDQRFYVNGTLIVDKHLIGIDSKTSTLSFWLFALHNSGSGQYGTSAKMYSYKMLKDNDYVRYFIPAKVSKEGGVTDVKGGNAPQGTVGMYDGVTGKFYPNELGTLIAGSELTD